MTRYLPSKHYQYAGVVALVLALFCGAFALEWPIAWISAGVFLALGGALLLLSFMPPIEIHDTHLVLGDRLIGWDEVRRIDRTGFISPLVLHLELTNDRRVLLVYPGGMDGSNLLLRHIRKMAKDALIDGIPYRQFWGEGLPSAADRKALPSPKYQLVRPEDEMEIERMYQRLKTVGHIDPRSDD